MGSTYHISAVDRSGSLTDAKIAAAVDAALATVNSQMSNWDPQSEVSQLNARSGAGSVTVSEELATVLAAANQVHRASDGAFDVTLGPLIELWGFGAKGAKGGTPSDAALAAALAQVGQNSVFKLDGRTVTKRKPGGSIYLSGIAKGYGVDQIGAALVSLGLQDFMIEIGGDLLTSGRNLNGAAWRIGVETPDVGAQSLQKVIAVTDAGLATSGDYRNYFEKDGRRFSHILDPRTGRPVEHRTASATVIAENAMLADAWATAMLALGRERGEKVADAEGLAVLFIERGENGFVSSETTAFRNLLS